MPKRTYKLGQFSTRTKTAFQDEFRKSKAAEKGTLSPVQALSARRGSRSNIPKYQAPTAPQIDANIPFDYTLATTFQIPVSQFVKRSNQTGVLSKADVQNAANIFAEKLKQAQGVQKVNALTGAGMSGFSVEKEFQTAKFMLNPSTLTFTSSGWNLNIPENYVKKSDTLYVAPSQQYAEFRRSTDDKKQRRTDYAEYTPVELYLTPEGKLSKVVKRDVYVQSEHNIDYDDGYKDISRSTPYTSRIDEYYSSGLKKSSQSWDDYVKKEKDTTTSSKYDEIIDRAIFQKENIQYAPTGQLMTSLRYSPYKTTSAIRPSMSPVISETGQQLRDAKGNVVYETQPGDIMRDARGGYVFETLSGIFGKQQGTDTEKYDIGLQEIKYFDLDTGELISQRLW